MKQLKFLITGIVFLEIFTSCSVKLKSDMFFDKPFSKIRLLEAENFSKTNLNYKVENLQVNDSIKIEIWEISSQQPENLFLLFSPSQTSIAESGEIMEKIAQRTNSKVVGIQYRGYNFSDGKPEFETSFKDNSFIFNYLKPEFKNYKTVNLIGMSIGTVFIPKVLQNNENLIDNIFLLSTFSSAKTMLKGYKKRIPFIVRPFIKFKPDSELLQLNNLRDLENYKNGLMIVQAKDDKSTSYEMALELLGKSQSPKKELVTLEDGGHSAPYSEKYINTVVDKIKEFIER